MRASPKHSAPVSMAWALVVCLHVFGCTGGGEPLPDAGQVTDGGGVTDAGEVTDGGELAAAPETREVVPAAGRVSGGDYTADVQLGGIGQRRASGGPFTVEGNATVKP